MTRSLLLASTVAVALVVGCTTSADSSTSTEADAGTDSSVTDGSVAKDSGTDSAVATDASDSTDASRECPTPSPPFCDGGPMVTVLVNGCPFPKCAPVTCQEAGGTCVAVVPGACSAGNVGDAMKYSCGGGLGTQCCLP